jgi:predicted Ser/Thr protein kinase
MAQQANVISLLPFRQPTISYRISSFNKVIQLTLPYNLQEKPLPLVGEGSQGKVYLIDPQRCIKIYHRPEFLPFELEILLKAYYEPQFPKVYEWGDNYMIREYIPGAGLKDYLLKNPLTEDLSRQIAELFLAFERLGFHRLDTRMAHVLVTPEGRIKAIDPANAMCKSGAYPQKFLKQLAKLGWKDTFFQHLKAINPVLYARWT